MKISLIAAVGKNNVIGSNGDLPWHLPDDMKFFSKTTKGHHVLMGRKNYESIPAKFRPLPGRANIIITRQKDFKDIGIKVFNSIEEGIKHAQLNGESELFIIGGGEIYRQTINVADRLYITHVDTEPEGDAHFPDFNLTAYDRTTISEHPIDDVHNFSFRICVYDKK